jgi:cytidylate kinase
MSTPDRYVETLAKLQHFAETPEAARAKGKPITVAVSRQAGSRGAEISQVVGTKLGWSVFDHELLDRIAQEKGLNARLLEQLDERHMGWLEEMATGLATYSASAETRYLRSLLELFASLSRAGHCVIVGRASPQVLPAETTLRVRVIAPRADRIANVQRSKHLSAAEAEQWIDRTDHERRRFTQHYFRKDPWAAEQYDLVLDSSRLGVETCADLIARAAQAMEKK